VSTEHTKKIHRLSSSIRPQTHTCTTAPHRPTRPLERPERQRDREAPRAVCDPPSLQQPPGSENSTHGHGRSRNMSGTEFAARRGSRCEPRLHLANCVRRGGILCTQQGETRWPQKNDRLCCVLLRDDLNQQHQPQRHILQYGRRHQAASGPRPAPYPKVR